MGELVGAHPHLPYAERLHKLTDAHIALWDVLASCERESSLDTHIRNKQANDFEAFFAQHPCITHVFFNGSKAEQRFNKFVLGKQKLPPLTFQLLPSTSPAHAGMRYADKLQAWGIESLKVVTRKAAVETKPSFTNDGSPAYLTFTTSTLQSTCAPKAVNVIVRVGRNNQRALRRMECPFGAMRYAYCPLQLHFANDRSWH